MAEAKEALELRSMESHERKRQRAHERSMQDAAVQSTQTLIEVGYSVEEVRLFWEKEYAER